MSASKVDTEAAQADEAAVGEGQTRTADVKENDSTIYRIYTHPWFQVILMGVICFCNPGVSYGPCM